MWSSNDCLWHFACCTRVHLFCECVLFPLARSVLIVTTCTCVLLPCVFWCASPLNALCIPILCTQNTTSALAWNMKVKLLVISRKVMVNRNIHRNLVSTGQRWVHYRKYCAEKKTSFVRTWIRAVPLNPGSRQWRSQPKILRGAKHLTQATVFGVGHRLSKHETTRYARNLGGMAPGPD